MNLPHPWRKSKSVLLVWVAAMKISLRFFQIRRIERITCEWRDSACSRLPVQPTSGEGMQTRLSPLSKTKTGRPAADRLLQLIEKQGRTLGRIPLGAPLVAAISSPFGMRTSPFNSRRHRMHHGVDIAASHGTPVEATASGTVTKAGYIGGYGNSVVVDHGRGYETVYGHLSKIEVTAGDKIDRGQPIGKVGSSGRSTGPHLHYEIRLAGEPINPNAYLKLASWLKVI